MGIETEIGLMTTSQQLDYIEEFDYEKAYLLGCALRGAMPGSKKREAVKRKIWQLAEKLDEQPDEE